MERWSKLPNESGVYIIKFDRNSVENSEPLHTIWLSDFKTLWSESFATKEALFKRISDENPTLITDEEMEAKVIAGLGTMDKTTQMNTSINPNDDEISLQMKYFIKGEISIKFHCSLKKCESHVFFDEITKPMLRQIGQLQDDRQQLIEVIEGKDVEIKMYKLDRTEPLLRKQFITKEFDKTAFALQSQMFNCEITEFESVIGVLPKNIVTKDSKDESTPVKDHTSNAKSPRGGKNRRRRLVYQEVVRPGVTYDNSDGDDDALKPVQSEDNPSKRTRCSSDF